MNIEVDRQNHKVHLRHQGEPVTLVLLNHRGKILKHCSSDSIYRSVVKKAISQLMWKISNRRIA
ncbi:hypothetical protein GCM10023116_39070 [Kistimonas scapharcae]|uniref:Uncharacterized protein n=1 Tax=Kistimonas scapharcae TaxID=1036133 RepID=A0ABP8V7Z1_9GAMM